jgi:peptide/nickel transport system permease protein
MTDLPSAPRPPSLARDLGVLTGQFLARHRGVSLCLALLAGYALLGLAAPLISGDPMAIAPANRLQPASAAHFWGTDHLGRDVYARAIWGTRNSLAVGFAVAALTTLFGTAIGIYAGFARLGGAVVMRLTDAMMSIPAILLAIALASLMGRGLGAVIVAITLPEIPRMIRLTRALTLSVRQQPYLTAAVSIGTRGLPLILRHVLPNMIGPVLVQASYACASAIITAAVLSFLGVGTAPEIPSWGGMMSEARAQFRIHPVLMLWPGLMLSALVLLVNILGDRLSDAIDPRKARRSIL